MKGKLLCEIHPLLYYLSVREKRLRRFIAWYLDKREYAGMLSHYNLPYRVKKHQSVLIRKLGNSDMVLQYNKVENIRIAIRNINGVVIRPGETFSFCKLVGNPTSERGFLKGMELSRGKARAGVGGGICQIANLIHWLVLHSPLTITERHHHSFDPFPDNGRVLPFGSGASVFYNYIDYQFENKTSHTFQLKLWLSEKLLEGELRIDEELPYAYHIYERNHEFLKQDEKYFRKNEIWRKKIDKHKGGALLEDKRLYQNFAEVKYIPEIFKSQNSL
ncbi:MAG: VanW family protein [Sporocytophaga sp.]|uniref:VanW family protein n=1 Tax=Sporocytophaga sp. TaxID=2231183 RepID=UPI001B24CA50|nr:VanW family protein [Sporocytophaga sp.]MBO9699532.1 VanW family protein [Sporocytophaga sp.]